MLFVVTAFCDAGSTIHFMLRSGPDFHEFEIHPFISFVSRIFGPVAGPIIGVIAKIVAAIPVAIYCRRFAVHIFLAASFVFLWAAWYNVWGHEIYTPNIFRWFSFFK